MSMHIRISAATAVFALSALALTGCGNGDAGAKTADDKPSATASTSSASSAPSASTSAASGTAGGNDNSGITQACSTKNTGLRFIQSAQHASQQQPAQAAIEVTNTSKATCVIVGAVTLTAKDDQGKAAPVSADNAGSGTDGVDVKPGATAKASVAYTDLNFDGSASGREICAVQASTVEFALPKDVGRTVKVTKDDGTAGSFDVCGKDVRISAFEAS
jgi:hypothetical protein